MQEQLLIDLVRSHEAVYNTKCSEYRDNKLRSAAWAEIAELYGSTVEECKILWGKIRNCFTNAKKRRQRKRDHKLEPWRFEEQMTFLKPYLKERRTANNMEVVFIEDLWEKNERSPEDPSTATSESMYKNKPQSFERENLLIELIRRYEVIYNTNCSDYRDAKSRNAAWAEIADLHGSTVDHCKDTWMKLRNCFTNALKRRQRRIALGKSEFLPPWRFEKQMSFLKPYLRERPSRENSEVILFDEHSWESSASVGMQRPESVSPTSPTSKSSYKRKASPDRDAFYGIDEENSQEIRYENQELDDLDHFFLSMSKMTKKLPKVDQLRIKLDLHKAINEAELKQLVAQEPQSDLIAVRTRDKQK